MNIGTTEVRIPDCLRADATGPDEEQSCVNRLRDWLQDNDDHPAALREKLPALQSNHRSRALRALRGTIDGAALLETLTLDDLSPNELYWFIGCLDPSHPDQRNSLRELAGHPVEWVAARALERLAETPYENEGFIAERLREETRHPVLVALLKKLLSVQGPPFTDALDGRLREDSPDAVTFYAAVLLKQRSPHRLDRLADDSAYFRAIRDQVDVDAPEEEGD